MDENFGLAAQQRRRADRPGGKEKSTSMNFLQRMERKFGKYAIRHLTMYIIMTYAAGYILSMMQSAGGSYGGITRLLMLSPSLILRGQIWRLVSWLLIPPSSLSIFTIIMLFCYYQLGTLLERTWGDFLYNVYIFFGLIMTVVGAFLLFFITGNDYGPMFTTYYVSLSIFLGFAMTFPDQQLLFMFIIPIKIKYLAVIDLIYLAYEIITYFRYGAAYGLPVLVMILCSLASTILFFFMTRRYSRFSPRERRRQRDFQKAMRGPGPFGTQGRTGTAQPRTPYEKVDRTTFAGGKKMAVHRCAVCGRTELDSPDLEFRFCSKCNGNYEYCQDHLYTHMHVQ